MALTAERKRQLAQMEIPSDDEVSARARDFQQRSGLTSAEFSQAIGYGVSSLSVFLNGNYSSALTADHDGSRNTLNIKARLLDFMNRWDAVQGSTRQQSIHRTADVERVTEACAKALANASAYVIDGPPGTQKTISLRLFEREIKQASGRGRAIYIYARQGHRPMSFLRELCNTAGIPNRGDIDKLVRKLRFFLAEQRILLMVDEAQHLEKDTLEVLRQLLDLPPYFGVVLAGSHQVSETLDSARMTQWHDRARATLELQGPSQAECREIIRAELQPIFPDRISDADCDEMIRDCWVTAVRSSRGEKRGAKTLNYISARLLFFAVADIHQHHAKQGTPANGVQKVSVA